MPAILKMAANAGSNVTADEYVTTDDNWDIEEYSNDIQNFIQDMNIDNMEWAKQLLNEAESDEEDECNLEEECVITNVKDALKHAEQLQNFFINAGDHEGIQLTSKVNMHIEKKFFKNSKQTNTYFGIF